MMILMISGLQSQSLQPTQRVCDLPFLVDFEVQVCPRCIPRIPHEGDDLPPPYGFSLRYNVSLGVGVQSDELMAMVQHHGVPITMRPAPAEQYDPIVCCHNRRASLAGDIDAGMEPSTAHTEA